MRRIRGYTLIEIAVVVGIIALISALVLVRFNLYKARQAVKSASQVLMSDIAFQQQRAFTLESQQGLTIAPGGNLCIYVVWSSEGDIPPRMVNVRELFSADVHFASGQADKQLIFFPWTADNTSEWSYVKSNNLNSIVLQGGDLSCTVVIEQGGKLRLVESGL